MDTEQLKEWAENIPIDDLFDEIRRRTGLSDLKFTHKVVERRGYIRIQFESQDLVDKVGFLKLLFKSIIISQFDSEVKYIEESNKLFWWGTADFSYSHPDGGSNGHTFLSFRYDDKGGWTFY